MEYERSFEKLSFLLKRAGLDFGKHCFWHVVVGHWFGGPANESRAAARLLLLLRTRLLQNCLVKIWGSLNLVNRLLVGGAQKQTLFALPVFEDQFMM